MLTDLQVLNGDMPLKFDKYVNTYSVNVTSDVTELDLVYEVSDGEVKVIENENLKEGLNYVYLEVINEDSKAWYTLKVYKEKTEVVFKEIVEEEVKREITNKETYTIIGVCIFLIILCFIVIYRPFRK